MPCRSHLWVRKLGKKLRSRGNPIVIILKSLLFSSHSSPVSDCLFCPTFPTIELCFDYGLKQGLGTFSAERAIKAPHFKIYFHESHTLQIQLNVWIFFKYSTFCSECHFHVMPSTLKKVQHRFFYEPDVVIKRATFGPRAIGSRPLV